MADREGEMVVDNRGPHPGLSGTSESPARGLAIAKGDHMKAIKFYSFLRAAAAGGATVPGLALSAVDGIGLPNESEISDPAIARICEAANALALAVHAASGNERDDFRPFSIEGTEEEPLAVFESANGTFVNCFPGGPYVRLFSGDDAPDNHYRYRAAESQAAYNAVRAERARNVLAYLEADEDANA